MMHRISLSRVFNALGYISLYVQFMWLVLLFAPTITEAPGLKPQATDQYVLEPTTSVMPEPVAVLLGALLIVIVFTLSVYAIIKGPRIAFKTSEATAHRATEKLVPLITHHKKITERKRRIISVRLEYMIKSIVAVVMFLALLFTFMINTLLAYSVIFAVGVFLLSWTLLWFLLSFLATLIQSKTSR